MAKKAKTSRVKSMADEIRVISINEATELPGLLGKVVSMDLREKGFCTLLLDDKKVFYELKAE